MINTGIVKEVDTAGRVHIPIRLRRSLGFEPGSAFEIYVDDEQIAFKRLQRRCIFCGDTEHLFEFRERNICYSCLDDMPDNE